MLINSYKNADSYIFPDWPAPTHIGAVSTRRLSGFSKSPYDSYNFGEAVGDDPQSLIMNQQKLQDDLALPAKPLWLRQIHSNQVICADAYVENVQADACYSLKPKAVCVITTADCLPILICSQSSHTIAAIHAGWRGLHAGIIEQCVAKLPDQRDQLMCWLGPAISQTNYEVGDEVRMMFLARYPQCENAFVYRRPGHWLADLYLLAKGVLSASGIGAIYGGNYCTYADTANFYSYRRDKVTGRMATLVWHRSEIT